MDKRLTDRTCIKCGANTMNHHEYCVKHYPQKLKTILYLKKDLRTANNKVRGLEYKITVMKRQKCNNCKKYIEKFNIIDGQLQHLKNKLEEMNMVYTKEKAIEFIKGVMKERTDINLSVVCGTACWKTGEEGKQDYSEMTPIQWKHIGYVSAIATAFDIDEV